MECKCRRGSVVNVDGDRLVGPATKHSKLSALEFRLFRILKYPLVNSHWQAAKVYSQEG